MDWIKNLFRPSRYCHVCKKSITYDELSKIEFVRNEYWSMQGPSGRMVYKEFPIKYVGVECPYCKVHIPLYIHTEDKIIDKI